jgi:glycosyltransferase involved in cell wall biosynthesis
VSVSRVCYVLATTQGGTRRHAAVLARGCAAAGISVCVVGPADTAEEMSGLGSVRFEPLRIGELPRPGRDASAIRRLRRLLAAMAPDVVHAHGMRAGGLAALALRPWSRPPQTSAGQPAARSAASGRAPALVVTAHNAPPPGAAGVIFGLLERIVARRADAVLCVSPDLSARMSRLGAREVSRAFVPAPATQPARLAAPETGAGADSGERPLGLGAAARPLVLAAGRLTAQKGLETLIEAARYWRDRVPVPLVAIAGTGPLAGALDARARAVGADVTFLGWRDDVSALLAAADVFVLPSRWEGQPLILQEALRAGSPIVATDVGGVRDLTGSEGALLVQPGDPAALAAAVLMLLDSPPAAAKLAAAAASRAGELPTEADAIGAALALYGRIS